MKKSFIGLLLLGLILAFEFPVFGQNDIIWVPIKVHILRKTDGSYDKNKKMGIDTLHMGIAYLNRKFRKANLQFFISEIDDNTLKDNKLYRREYALVTNIENDRITSDTTKYEMELTQTHDSPRAINLYIIPDHKGNHPASARFPVRDKLYNSHLFIQSNFSVPKSYSYIPFFSYTLVHEFGHIFGLHHTFAYYFGRENIVRNGVEANCQKAGDQICDTNADPYPKSSLEKIGTVTGLKRGSKFEGFTPPLYNIMAYYYTISNFHTRIYEDFEFSNEQIKRIRAYALYRQAWVNANFNTIQMSQPRPIITSINTGSTREIRWTDNSSMETGYFIERATNLDPQNFICVGGVGPNVSIYHDNVPLPANVSTIKYRVIPSNAKGTSAYSTEMALNIASNVLFGIPDFANNSLNQTISPKNISSIINICKNTSFPIEYYTEGAFAVNNQFKIQLSDQNGNFGANPLVIGIGTSSPINVVIPNQSFPNGNYKLRIVSTNPVTTSLASVDTYNIYPAVTPPVITATPANVSYGSASILKATGCTGTIYWSFNKTGSSQLVKPTENTTYTAYCKTNCKSDEGTISVTVNNTAGISNINYMEYFFDNDPGFGNGVAVNITPGRLLETTIPVNTTGLSQGLHTLHVRVKTASNQWSTTHTQTVLVYGTGNNNRIVKFEYFYDTDPGFDNGTAVTVSPDSLVYLEGEFRTNNLSQGLHRLFVRAKDGYNRWSTTEQTPVLVIGTGSTIGLLSSAEYFIDTDPGVGNATSVSIPSQTDATFSFNVNLSNVSQGVHVVYVRVKDNLNRWSTHQSQVFVKIPNTLTRQITRAEYFIDTDPGQGNATAIIYSPNPAQEMIANININANSLIKGEHTIYVRVKDSNNVWSVIASKLFEVESTPCPPVESLFLPSPSGLTQAMERIFSTSKIESNNKSTYQAGNSVLLSPGFETKSNVVFKVTISGCVND